MIDEPEVFLVFDSCIHVGMWHAPSLTDTRKIAGVLRRKANTWAKENGARVVRGGVSGWTLGPERDQSRAVFTIER